MIFKQALEQFELFSLNFYKIIPFGNYFLIFTNLNLQILFNLGILVIFFLFSLNKNVFFNSNLFTLFDTFFKFIFNVLFSQTGKKGIKYFPVINTMFFFILINNLFGLVPNNFCVTSQIFITFTLSFCVFSSMVIFSIIIQGKEFIWFFVPKNVPAALLPFLVIIEIVSYISRVFSLAIRLFANMVAGHALLHIISGSVLVVIKKISSFSVFLSFISLFPIFILLSIILLEFGVAFLQAYVFIVLFSIYLNDCYGHH